MEKGRSFHHTADRMIEATWKEKTRSMSPSHPTGGHP